MASRGTHFWCLHVPPRKPRVCSGAWLRCRRAGSAGQYSLPGTPFLSAAAAGAIKRSKGKRSSASPGPMAAMHLPDGGVKKNTSSNSTTTDKVSQTSPSSRSVTKQHNNTKSQDAPTTRRPPLRARSTHFTRKASGVAAIATGGGDGSGPSVVDRDRHDIFNIVALLPLIFLTFANYDWGVVLATGDPEASWTDEYFWQYWFATTLYFGVDLVWVWRVPTCVKSPSVIIKHHIVAIFYLAGPVLFPMFRWAMGACLSVEINTWFLIARRVAYLRRDAISNLITGIINVAFYVSWLAIRCFLYPLIMAIYVQKCQVALVETGTLLHWPVIFVPIHFILCLLNLKWSYDLFTPIVSDWFKSSGVQKGSVSDGL